MFKNLKFALYLSSAILITFGLSVSLQSLLAAWTAPTASAPVGNIYPPINQGTVTQTIGGGLTIGSVVANGLSVTGNSIFNNNLTVTGNLNASSFTGNGFGLTNISVSAIGGIDISRIVYGSNGYKTNYLGSSISPQSGSGFYESSDAADGPVGASWTHYLINQHSNSNAPNGYQMIIAQPYWEDNLYTRRVDSDNKRSWRKILDSGNYSAYARAFNTWQNSHYSGTDGAEYATIFYDANNSGYYVDPNATSRLNYGIYDNVYSYGWMQAPIMYDNNNTAYYVDPSSLSNTNYLYRTYGFNSYEYDVNNTAYYVNPDSTSIFNDLRANIFYDKGNSGYYVDPNGTSNLNSLSVGFVCYGGSCMSPTWEYGNYGSDYATAGSTCNSWSPGAGQTECDGDRSAAYVCGVSLDTTISYPGSPNYGQCLDIYTGSCEWSNQYRWVTCRRERRAVWGVGNSTVY